MNKANGKEKSCIGTYHWGTVEKLKISAYQRGGGRCTRVDSHVEKCVMSGRKCAGVAMGSRDSRALLKTSLRVFKFQR